MAYADADEDELVSPSTLWATATRTPRRNPARRPPLAASSSNNATPTSTPTQRRTSPRFARARELEKTPPPLPPPKTPSRKTVVDDELNKLTDSDEKRRKALADELFPPSPPGPAATTYTPVDADAWRAGAVDGLEEEEEEVVADSEVEREREYDELQLRLPASPGSPALANPSLTSGTGVRQRCRDSRRTSSIVFDLDDPASVAGVVPDSQGQGAIAAIPSDEEDQGTLARRLDQLQLGCVPSFLPSVARHRFAMLVSLKMQRAAQSDPAQCVHDADLQRQ